MLKPYPKYALILFSLCVSLLYTIPHDQHVQDDIHYTQQQDGGPIDQISLRLYQVDQVTLQVSEFIHFDADQVYRLNLSNGRINFLHSSLKSKINFIQFLNTHVIHAIS